MTVDVVAVERELARIQRELTSSEVRTSLFNLVIFSPDAQQLMADRALNHLLGKRAARVIHIVSGDVPESRLDVSARCFVDAEKKSVCFQEIVITNGKDEAGGAPGTWVPLLVRDIPTTVWWMDSVCRNWDLLNFAREQADKLLVDTEVSAGLGDPIGELLPAIRELAIAEGVPVVDFAFKRLMGAMNALAAVFDDAERTPLLYEIRSVEISGLNEIASGLLTLWLSERLGWRRTSGGHTDRSGESLEVRVNPEAESNRPATIRIEWSKHEPVVVSQGADGCVEVDCDDLSWHPILSGPDNGQLLLDEVDSAAGDGLYRAALSSLEVAAPIDGTNIESTVLIKI